MVGEVVAFSLINLNILSPCSLKWRWQWHDIVAAISLSTYCITCCRYVKSPGCSHMDHSMTFQFSSVTQSCLTICDPMNCSTPGLPVHHQLLKSTKTHVHRVGDAIQPSHPLSSPSPPAPNPSQHQSLFKWVSSSHQVAEVLGFQLQLSVLPKNTHDWSPLGWTGWISLQSKGLSRAFSNTTVQKQQFFGTQLSSQSNSHIHTWPLEKP